MSLDGADGFDSVTLARPRRRASGRSQPHDLRPCVSPGLTRRLGKTGPAGDLRVCHWARHYEDRNGCHAGRLPPHRGREGQNRPLNRQKRVRCAAVGRFGAINRGLEVGPGGAGPVPSFAMSLCATYAQLAAGQAAARLAGENAAPPLGGSIFTWPRSFCPRSVTSAAPSRVISRIPTRLASGSAPLPAWRVDVHTDPRPPRPQRDRDRRVVSRRGLWSDAGRARTASPIPARERPRLPMPGRPGG